MSEKMKLGFVGVGVMGRPMARRLIEHGHSLVIYDRDEQALAELSAIGAQVVGSAREVADSAQVVFTSLPTPAIFKEVALVRTGWYTARLSRSWSTCPPLARARNRKWLPDCLKKASKRLIPPSAAAQPVRKKARSPSWPRASRRPLLRYANYSRSSGRCSS